MKPSKKIVLIALTLLFLFVFGAAAVLAETEGLPNPLGEGNTDPRVIIGNVIKAGLGIIGSLALAVFIFGGFPWVIAAGNDEKIKKGKDMIMWAALGLIVIFLSYALVTFILGAIGGAGGEQPPVGRVGEPETGKVEEIKP